MANGNDIIIKGGSVDIDYDEGVYPKDPGNPKKHKNQNKKITRVLISGDINFDSGDRQNGITCDITISCK
jgi:hypothetical protein